MNTASLALSKELFELSDWSETDFNWYRNYDDAGIVWISLIDGANGVYICPAYDLGYLLQKFADRNGIDVRVEHVGYVAISSFRVTISDTAEEAVCQLAIDLFNHGIFIKEH